MKKCFNLGIFCFCLFAFHVLQAQEVKFGKIAIAELEEKFNPLDSSAVATYLYKKRRTYFEYESGEGFKLITSIHHRIKIYNQEGFDYATRKISLYKKKLIIYRPWKENAL